MSQRIGWGILATGAIAAAFAEDLAHVQNAEAVAVGSRSAAAAAVFAARHSIGRTHGSWAELAADPEVDVVYVATPHVAHHAAASVCLQAGKAVLCEKPFTTNAGEAQQLVDRARRQSAFLMEAMWMRTNPAIRQLVEVVAGNAIGDLRAVHADFGLPGPFEPGHRLRDPHLGGGALLDLGVYPVSLAHLLLGVPATIAASARLTAEGVDANTRIMFGYDSGAVAQLSCSIEAAGPRTATIIGARGRITLETPFFRPAGFILHRNGTEPERVSVPYDGLGYVHEIQETGRCIEAGLLQSPLVPWQSSLEVLRILDTVRAQIGVTYPSEGADRPGFDRVSDAASSAATKRRGNGALT